LASDVFADLLILLVRSGEGGLADLVDLLVACDGRQPVFTGQGQDR
jgi:hypothetical protein